MHDLGQALKRRRETLGMGIEDVERHTKIRRRYLEALEAGDWSILPGDVYARGFVRSYAELVGLDGLKLLEDYIDGPKAERTLSSVMESSRPGSPQPVVADARPETPMPDSTLSRRDPEALPEGRASSSSERKMESVEKRDQAQRPDSGAPYTPPARRTKPVAVQAATRRTSRGGGALGQGIAVVVAFAVVAGAWWYISGRNHSTANHPTAISNTPSVTGNQAVNSSTTNSATGNDVTANTTTNATATTNNSASGNGTGNSPASTAVVSQQPFVPQSGQLNVTVAVSGPIVLDATASGGQCWVSVVADGQTIDGNDFVVPGSTKTWNGNQEVRIRLGNVPVVSLTVNGTPIVLPNTHYAIYVDIKKSTSQP